MQKMRDHKGVCLISLATVLVLSLVGTWFVRGAKASEECREMLGCQTWSCGTTMCGNVGGAPTAHYCDAGDYSHDGAGQCDLKFVWEPVHWDCALPYGYCGGEQAQFDPGCW